MSYEDHSTQQPGRDQCGSREGHELEERKYWILKLDEMRIARHEAEAVIDRVRELCAEIDDASFESDIEWRDDLLRALDGDTE